MSDLLQRIRDARYEAVNGTVTAATVAVLLDDVEIALSDDPIQRAMKACTYSESEAIQAIARVLNGGEGLVTSSKVADACGLTRSVIVSALSKFESAGVIESRSLGMKGTMIKAIVPGWQQKVLEAA